MQLFCRLHINCLKKRVYYYYTIYIHIIIIRFIHVHCTWYRSRSPFLLRLGHGPILVQKNLQHSQAQLISICIRVIYLTQTHLEKQLVPFLKSLVWLGLGCIRTLDLPNSKWTLYHYTRSRFIIIPFTNNLGRSYYHTLIIQGQWIKKGVNFWDVKKRRG